MFINNSDSKDEADSTVKKIALVSQRFLDVKLEYVGYMLHDQNVSIATRMQKPFTALYPNTKATSCLNKLVATLLKNSDSTQSLGVGRLLQKNYECSSI
ncbi:hypothetical protein [Candidatus Kuenenia stuttgartiensis]|uniref:hypothetical protein n=1 Tax=Kuenenia stuttgartiensis TaxID=174633 RepID=UPI00146EA9CB|nr:hypothetical protein [Candidatus Kuenenia stuttgartiensis]